MERVIELAKRYWLFAATLAGLTGGAVAWALGRGSLADGVWAAITVIALIPLVIDIGRQLLARRAGVDVIAVLAMAGSLALGEYLTGAVIAIMVATGIALEEYAQARASRELSSLLQRAPRTAVRVEAGQLVTVPIEEVQPGDILVVRDSDVVPVDGIVAEGVAVLDESALTGESRLVERGMGERVASGVVNAGSPFRIRAAATAEASTYAGIIRLVRAAQESKAPLVRLADRYAMFFLPLTLVVAGVAWALAGTPARALAVVVVATPCPLLLAAPIAIVSGVSRSAKRGIVVKGGGAIEVMARARAVYMDKTGTLTAGSPVVDRVAVFGAMPEPELLRLAAAFFPPRIDQPAGAQQVAEFQIDQAGEKALCAAAAGIVARHAIQEIAVAFGHGDIEQIAAGAGAAQLRRRHRLEKAQPQQPAGNALDFLQVEIIAGLNRQLAQQHVGPRDFVAVHGDRIDAHRRTGIEFEMQQRQAFGSLVRRSNGDGVEL